MRSGTLRDRITIQKPTTALRDNQWGRTGEQFGDLATNIAASVLPITAREQLRAGGIQSETTYTIRIRYRSDVTDQCRVIYRGLTLDISSVIDVGGRRRELEIVASQNPPEVTSGQ